MRRFKTIVALAILAALAAAFFWPVLSHPDYLMTSGRGDLVELFAVRTHYQVTNTLKNGELTLWDPHAACGAPVVGNVQNATFYPLSILFYIMPTDGAFGFIFLADTLLAGWFAYLFVRSFGLSRGAGLAGAITYMFSGIWTSTLFYGSFMCHNNFPWMVLGLYLVRKVVISVRARRWSAGAFFALLLAISQAVQFLGGHTQYWVYSTALLIAFSIFEVFYAYVAAGSLRTAVGAGLVCAALAVGVLLTMIQLLPAVEFAGQVLDEGKRPADYLTLGAFSNAASVMALVPHYYGFPIDGSWRTTWIPEWSIIPYLGLLPLIFLISAPFIARNGYVWFFCGVCVFAILFSYGNGSPVFWLMARLPGFSAFRLPQRIFAVALPGVAVLVGFVWNRLFATRPSRSKWVPMVAVGVALLIAGYMVQMLVSHEAHAAQLKAEWSVAIKNAHDEYLLPAYFLPDAEAREKAEWSFAKVRRELIVGMGICVVSAGLFVLSGRGPRAGIICGVAALAIIGADLMSFGMPYVSMLPVNDARVYPEHTPLLDRLNALSKDEPPSRILIRPMGAPQPLYSQLRRRGFNIFNMDLDSSQLRYVQQFQYYAYSDPRVINDVLSEFNVRYYLTNRPMLEYQEEFEKRVNPENPKPVDRQAYEATFRPVDWVGDVCITENLECFDRAFVVRHVTPMVDKTPDEMMAHFADKKFMKSRAIIEEWPDFTLSGKGEFQNASITDYKPNRVTVEVTLDEPGFLVLSEVWYPDWHAYDVADGGRSELHVYKTNLAMRGVFLKAGKHKVEFVYEPRSYYLGKKITLIALPAVLVALAVFGILAFRRRSRPLPDEELNRH